MHCYPRAILTLVCLLIAPVAEARFWKSISIPGAVCGDGSQYKVFYDKGPSNKLAIELMGGGACWDAKTCLGPLPVAWILPLPKLPVWGQFSVPLKSVSPAGDHSYLFFPYCTGDVHVGQHTAEYLPGIKIHHRGLTNVREGLRYLAEKRIIPFDQVEDIILYGASAGGIGALAHAHHVDQWVPASAKRTLIADSPGLHWGNDFWGKFRAPMVRDLSFAFAKMGVLLDMYTGNLGPQIPQMCHYLSHWNIALLQGSRDRIMSQVFGDITPEEHERRIYAEDGMFQNTTKTGNCWAWTPSTSMHTFLLAPTSLVIRPGGVSALNFVNKVYNRVASRNYR